MIEPDNFDCRHHRVPTSEEDVGAFEEAFAHSLPADLKYLVLNFAGCTVVPEVVYATERGNRTAWGLHLERFFAFPKLDWSLELAEIRGGRESQEQRTVSFGLSLLGKVPWTPGTPWTDSILPIGMCGMSDGGLLCLDFAFDETSPAVIVVPVVTGGPPGDPAFIPPQYVASSVTEVFEQNVQEFDEEIGQYPWERALDLQQESWIPTSDHLRWNAHRSKWFGGPV